MLLVVTAVLGVVGEVVQVVTTAGVASPYPEGARRRRNTAKNKVGSAGRRWPLLTPIL